MRRSLILSVAVAPALALAGLSTPVHASGITSGMASYELTAPNGLPPADPKSSGPQVVAEIKPIGAVVPPVLPDKSEGSPLTILPDSHGFDQSNLVVGLKNNSNPPQQLLGLAFDNQGLQPGGLLHFSLNLDKSITTPPALESLTPGVSIIPDPTKASAATGTVNTAPTTVNTPEPLSVILWSMLAGMGLVRARVVRRSRMTAA